MKPVRLPTSILRLIPLILVGISAVSGEEIPPCHFSTFGAGFGPTTDGEGTFRLLDTDGLPQQSNAIAWDSQHAGSHESFSLTGNLRVLEGGDGGAIVFLNTAEYGARGPAPFVRSWVEPNLRKTLAVGIDVHNPPSDEMFGPLAITRVSRNGRSPCTGTVARSSSASRRTSFAENLQIWKSPSRMWREVPR